MALNIKDPQTDALARRVAELSGQSITEAVRSSLEARLAQLIREDEIEPRRSFMLDIVYRARQQHDTRAGHTRPTAEEMLGYDETGLPS